MWKDNNDRDTKENNLECLKISGIKSRMSDSEPCKVTEISNKLITEITGNKHVLDSLDTKNIPKQKTNDEGYRLMKGPKEKIDYSTEKSEGAKNGKEDQEKTEAGAPNIEEDPRATWARQTIDDSLEEAMTEWVTDTSEPTISISSTGAVQTSGLTLVSAGVFVASEIIDTSDLEPKVSIGIYTVSRCDFGCEPMLLRRKSSGKYCYKRNVYNDAIAGSNLVFLQ